MAKTADEPWTVLKLLDWTKGYFTKSGLDDPRLCAEVLLAHVLGLKRIELYTHFADLPDAERLTTFRELVKRAAAREPVAYLTGAKEFYSLGFAVTPDVLIPRPETEGLVSEAISHLRSLGRPGFMWDACTGSGCVAVATAVSVPELTVLATDISPRAVQIATANAAAHKLDGRVRCRVADLLALPADCADLADFDVIAANPPYIAKGQAVSPAVRHEPQVALYSGPDGTELLARVIAAAPDFLRPGGVLAVEFGLDQARKVGELFGQTGRFDQVRIIRDHNELERIAVAKKRGGDA
ncbi:MAG: peptide chain release factor N(5)-glutamine methyltransferase [Planctomycetes bacterium]|nr:peptide chain release factor N(5)-glutamine methyltransferase [Planctomycetota bacterium]